MSSTRFKVVQSLRKEASDVRAWADTALPERARVEPYMMAARLERLASELADEPVWLRVGADVSESTRAILTTAQREFKRRRK